MSLASRSWERSDLRIAATDALQTLRDATQEAIDGVGQIASNLIHPGAVRLAHDASDVDATGLEVDDEQDRY